MERLKSILTCSSAPDLLAQILCWSHVLGLNTAPCVRIEEMFYI